MIDILKNIAKHSVIYGLGTVLRKGIGFFMIPIYTRFLLPEDYGILEMLELFTSMFGILVFIAIRSAIVRIYYEYEEKNEQKEVISTALIATSIICGVAVGVLLNFSSGISQLIFMNKNHGSLVTLVLITFYLQTIGDVGFAHLQIKQQSVFFTILSVIKVFIQLSLNILFLVVLKQGVYGLLLGGLISSVIVALYFLVNLAFETRLKFSKTKLNQMLSFGIPLIPANIATFIVNYIDRYLLNYFFSLAAVGIYSLSYKFGMLIQIMITGPFISIWMPKRLEISRQNNAKSIYALVTTYYFLIVCFIALSLSVFSRELILIMADAAYIDAYKYIGIIAFSYVISGLVYHYNIGMHIQKKTKYVSYINVPTAIINVLLNLILIPKFFIWGAAISTFISFIFRSLCYLLVNQKIFPIPFETIRMLKITFVCIFLYCISFQIDSHSIILNILIKFNLCLLFFVILFLLRFFTEQEIRQIKSQVNRIKNLKCLKAIK